MNKSLILWSILFLCFTGCSQKFEISQTNIEKKQKEKDDDNVLFIADNQKALLLTYPIYEQSGDVERTVGTAHRRASLDEFSLDILKYINQQSSSNLIIHAGDLLNNSCKKEYDSAVKMLNNFKKPWYIAPGNHDGYYLGISSPMKWGSKFQIKDILKFGLLNERNGWNQVCQKFTSGTIPRDTESIIDKFSFVQKYINSIGIRNINVQLKYPLEEKYGKTIVCKFSKDQKALDIDRNGYLNSICWTQNPNYVTDYNKLIDKRGNDFIENKPWEHFVVQLLTINYKGIDRNILIIDSSNYEEGKGINKNGIFSLKGFGAADNAHLSDKQIEIINLMTLNKEIDIIIGHHPLNDYKDEKVFDFVTELINESRNKLYISGDTHNGYDVYYTNEKKKFRESNLGSTIDAPLEYAKYYFEDSYLERISLTPLMCNNKYKKSKLKKFHKNYAILDRKWEECFKKFRIDKNYFNKNNLVSDPLMRLKNSDNLYEVKYSDKFIIGNEMQYKIKRLLQLIDVYKDLYSYVGIENKFKTNDEYEMLKNNLEYHLKGLNRRFKNQEGSILRYSGKMIEFFREGLNNLNKEQLERVNEYKVCSAILESEREYLNYKKLNCKL